jgi:hypothetical protein
MHTPPSKAWIALVLAITACGSDRGDAADAESSESSSSQGADPSGNPSGNPSGDPATTNSSASSTSTGTSTTTEDSGSTDTSSDATSSGVDPDSSSSSETGLPGDEIYEQDFAGPDGSPWPDPWEVIGDGVISSELDDGRGRMAGTTLHTGRIALPGFDELDVDAYATVTFEDPSAQGFGFYVRQNGGALQDTNPPGLGYSLYLEGAFMRSIGIWRETNGVEEPVLETADPISGGLVAGEPYRVRFQCFQSGDMTTLRAKVWHVDDAEPASWAVSVEDGTPELQDYAGSFAVDNYNYEGTGSMWVDDIVISRM